MKSPSPQAGNARIAIREILLIGLLSAVLIIVQVAKALIAPFLPNIELVSLFIIVYTLVIGKKVFYIIYVFVLAEGMVFGFGIWWISYLYVWSILAIVVLLLRKAGNTVIWVIVSGVFGLLFGALTAIPYLFTGGIGAAAAYWVSGIPFDLLHCAGNIIAAALLLKPCLTVLEKLYLRENTRALADNLP